MRAFNTVTSQCGRQKVGLACYVVGLTFWGQCLVFYMVRLAFCGWCLALEVGSKQCLDALLAESVQVAGFDRLCGGERTHSHHQDGGGLGPP